MGKNKFEAHSFSYHDASQVWRTQILTSGQLHSRESCGVWHFDDGRAWKIFSSRDQHDKIKNAYDLATSKGLPTPEYEFFKGTVIPRAGCAREGFALASTFISGHFFALDQKNPGPRPFMNVINSITDVRVLYKIEEDLRAAEAIGLRDPQGFIDPTSVDHPIMFIDLHTNTTPSVSVTTMRDAVSERRSRLQPEASGILS